MIISIDFSATLPPREIRGRLLESITTSISVKGAIAYWTINTEYFRNKLANLLAHPNSFMCVDLQLPTNIDKLVSFVSLNSNIYLHHYVLSTQIPGEVKENLMHEKVLLFEFEDSAEIWVGSHNMTKRALSGINKEAAIIIKLSKDEDLYWKVNNHLMTLRDICIPFKLEDVDYYKWLQGKYDNPVTIIKMFTPEPGLLSLKNSTIQLLGLEKFGFNKIKTVNKDLCIEVTNGVDTVLFSAEVLLAANIDSSNPATYEINFQPMNHAFIQKDIIPVIINANKYNLNSSNTKHFSYFVNIQIKKPINELDYVKLPVGLWKYEKHEVDQSLNKSDQTSLFDIPNYITIKRAAIENFRKSNSTLVTTEKKLKVNSLEKIIEHYDKFVSQSIRRNEYDEKDTIKLESVPNELKTNSKEIIFKVLLSK